MSKRETYSTRRNMISPFAFYIIIIRQIRQYCVSVDIIWDISTILMLFSEAFSQPRLLYANPSSSKEGKVQFPTVLQSGPMLYNCPQDFFSPLSRNDIVPTQIPTIKFIPCTIFHQILKAKKKMFVIISQYIFQQS